jgi:hypothetical protein
MRGSTFGVNALNGTGVGRGGAPDGVVGGGGASPDFGGSGTGFSPGPPISPGAFAEINGVGLADDSGDSSSGFVTLNASSFGGGLSASNLSMSIRSGIFRELPESFTARKNATLTAANCPAPTTPKTIVAARKVLPIDCLVIGEIEAIS